MVACTSQNAGAPVVAFAGIAFAEAIDVCAIEADARALHASCAETVFAATTRSIDSHDMRRRTVEDERRIRIMAVSLHYAP
jgi:hypothetical protein